MDVTDASAELKRTKSSTGSGAFMQTAPMVAEMARERRPIRQGAACAYAESLTEEQRTDFAGCYVWRCGKAGIPVSCSYNFGLGNSKYLCWSVNTIPFGCFAMPLEYEQGARYVSLKRDTVVMVVDDERRTLACYPGVGVEKTQCCLCEKIA